MGEVCAVWHAGDGGVCVFCGEDEFRLEHGGFALFLGCGVQVGVELRGWLKRLLLMKMKRQNLMLMS